MKTKHVLVVGGGAAGIAAAVAAAQQGARVSLAERSHLIGGNATAAEVGTVCGLYRYERSSESAWAVSGFAREFAEKLQERSRSAPLNNLLGLHYLPYDPDVFESLAREYLEQNGVALLCNASLVAVNYGQGQFSSALLEQASGQIPVHFDAIVDCSGESWVSRLAGLPVIEDPVYQASAQVFTLSGCNAADEASLGMILLREVRQGIENKKLLPELDRVTIVPGSLRNGLVKLKLGLNQLVDNSTESRELLQTLAHNRVKELANYLCSVRGPFEQAVLAAIAPQVGIRTGIRSVGEYTLRKADVLNSARFDDVIAYGNWPIEMWGLDKRVQMQYFPEKQYYDIPAGCVKSKHVPQLFFAGRILSADTEAIASARVIGTCFQTGFAAGIFAAGKALGIAPAVSLEIIQGKL